jgi:hypothetical protein
MTGPLDHAVPGHADLCAEFHLTGRRQVPRHLRQCRIAGQDGQVTQRIETHDDRAERRSARQRIHPHRGAIAGRADRIQDMPGGHQHAR